MGAPGEIRLINLHEGKVSFEICNFLQVIHLNNNALES